MKSAPKAPRTAASWQLAIDVGVAASIGAIRTQAQAPEILEIDGDATVPSLLLFKDGTVIVGEMARRQAALYPSAVLDNLIGNVGGQPFKVQDNVSGPRTVPVMDALTSLLKVFTDEGTRLHSGREPSVVMLMCPARWSFAEREFLRYAGKVVAPKAEVKVVPGPVAAAHHYSDIGFAPRGHKVGVYDLGGGTFDAAVLRIAAAGRHLLVGRPGGDAKISGTAFDRIVLEHFGQTLAQKAPRYWAEARNGGRARELLTMARSAREELSEKDESITLVRLAGVALSITRPTYEKLINDRIDRTIQIMDRTIDQAGPTTVSGIVVTGGAARTPLVAHRLRSHYGADRIRLLHHAKPASVLGAFAWNDVLSRPSP